MKTKRYLDTCGDVLLTFTKSSPKHLPIAAQEAVMDGVQTTQLINPSSDGNINAGRQAIFT